jgi:hypothetical protein
VGRVTAIPLLRGIIPLLSGITPVVTGRRGSIPAITRSPVAGLLAVLAVGGRRAISSVLTSVASAAAHQSAEPAETATASVPAAPPGLLAQELAEQPLALISEIVRSRWERIWKRRGALCLRRRRLYIAGCSSRRNSAVWGSSRPGVLLLLQLTCESFVLG